jgi:sphinganine-1-phosphate aldolase
MGQSPYHPPMPAEPIPEKGLPVDGILQEIRARREGDADWRGGRTFSLIYNSDNPELEQLQERVALEFLHENALNPFAFPSLTDMEAEVVAWGAGLMHGPGLGRLSSGGTESIFLAVQTARDHARAGRGITNPLLLTAETAHPAFAKAAKYLQVEHQKVTVGSDGRADAAAMTARMDAHRERVVLVVGSAPCYPFGVVDPIPELAGAAAERDILFHTDACLGGWLLPFWEQLGHHVPAWDFRVEGVTSISADVHKYGWTIKGASLILYRDEELLRHQFFLYDEWPGGLYGSATTAGTRPAAPIAVAWATVRHLGLEGYLSLARQVFEVTGRFRSGIEAIGGLGLTHQPDMSVMQIGADPRGVDRAPDIGAVGDFMDDRGWYLDRQQGGLHLMLWPYHRHVVDDFLSDLAAAAATDAASRGKTATYGGTG